MRQALKLALSKETRMLLRQVFYMGSKFHCCVCDHSVRTMFTAGYGFPVLSELDVVGGETIADDVCPVCFGNSRTRLLSCYLQRECGIETTSVPVRVLHIAPEHGIAARLMRNPLVSYVAGDLFPEKYADLPLLVRCDVTALGFPAASFDVVICSHVLEHVPDDQLAMRELARVLAPGGKAILQTPVSAALSVTLEDVTLADPAERERRFGQNDHVRIYGADYTTRLARNGFGVEVFEPAAHWGADAVAAMKLNPRERVYVGHKPGG